MFSRFRKQVIGSREKGLAGNKHRISARAEAERPNHSANLFSKSTKILVLPYCFLMS